MTSPLPPDRAAKGATKGVTTYYKLARENGFDFYTGGTINYRDAIGSRVKAPDWQKNSGCGYGLHFAANPLDCFVGARIPCSAYIVEPGRNVVTIDAHKSKAQSLKVVEEITDLDTLFGFKYSEATKPFNPLSLTTKPSEEDLALLATWDSVGASVRDSVWDSVGDSVGASVRDSVWDSVGASVWASVGASVWASVWAYVGSLFPAIEKWAYVPQELQANGYPFQSAVDLWYRGLVPSYVYRDETWRLHTGPNAEIVWEGKRSDLPKPREEVTNQ